MHISYKRRQRDRFWDKKLKDFSRMLTKQRCKYAESVLTLKDRQFDECQTKSTVLSFVKCVQGAGRLSQRTLRRGALAILERD